MFIKLWQENLKEERDLDPDGRIILKYIFEKCT
jgi:hypothetical protein